MNQTAEYPIENLDVGFRVGIVSPVDSTEIKCELLIKEVRDNGIFFYIHYCGLNKRYDCWKNVSEFILTNVEASKKNRKNEYFRLRNIYKVTIRNFEVDSWYFSPYPKDFEGHIYVCEFCLYYFKSHEKLNEHAKSCDIRFPPGIKVYDDGRLTFFEVDGYVQKNYCRNLSLFSKLFLDHKSLHYDIDVFLYYVLCVRDEIGYQIVGYFSKEKISEQGNNLACILTLPFEQRKGYGKILIDFSYMLSKIDNNIAGPEKPLSDLGLLTYRAYWLEVILEDIAENKTVNIKEMSTRTHITQEDIMSTFFAFKMVKYYGDDLVIGLDEKMLVRLPKPRRNKVYMKYLIKDF